MEEINVGARVRIRESCLNVDGYEMIYAPHRGLTGRVENVSSHKHPEPTYTVIFDVPRRCSTGGYEANASGLPAMCLEALD